MIMTETEWPQQCSPSRLNPWYLAKIPAMKESFQRRGVSQASVARAVQERESASDYLGRSVVLEEMPPSSSQQLERAICVGVETSAGSPGTPVYSLARPSFASLRATSRASTSRPRKLWRWERATRSSGVGRMKAALDSAQWCRILNPTPVLGGPLSESKRFPRPGIVRCCRSGCLVGDPTSQLLCIDPVLSKSRSSSLLGGGLSH